MQKLGHGLLSGKYSQPVLAEKVETEEVKADQQPDEYY